MTTEISKLIELFHSPETYKLGLEIAEGLQINLLEQSFFQELIELSSFLYKQDRYGSYCCEHCDGDLTVAFRDFDNRPVLKQLDYMYRSFYWWHHCTEISIHQTENIPENIHILPTIEKVMLYRNSFLPSSVLRLTKLQKIHWMHVPPLYNIPISVENSKLRSVELYKSRTRDFHENLYKAKHLKYIYIHETQIDHFKKDLGQLTQLEELLCPKNALQYIPDEIGQLTNLKHLDLSNNNLTKLPKTIGQLKALETLNLKNNQLRELPIEILQLKNLKYIRLNGNPLPSFPEFLRQLPKLKIGKFKKHRKAA